MYFVFSAHSNPPLQQTKIPLDLHKDLGSTQEITPREKEDLFEKKLVCFKLEDGNRLLPKVHLESIVFQELCTP